MFKGSSQAEFKAVYSLSKKLHYSFTDADLLTQALKHRSYLVISGEKRVSSNERLELLGDAVLGMIVTEHLFRKYPKKGEGDLTVIKSVAVSRKVLSSVAAEIGLGEYILLNDSERRSGGNRRPSILSDTLEALIGAIYLDGGLPAAKRFILETIVPKMEIAQKAEHNRNYKSLLLEFCQKRRMPIPQYVVKKEEGPDHNKLFTVQVFSGKQGYGVGSGRSKKRAEQKAAREALKKLKII